MAKHTQAHSAPGSTTYWEYAFHYVTDILKFEKKELTYIVLYGVAVGLLSLAVPLATQTIVNATAFTALPAPVLVLTAIVLGVLVLSSLIRLLQVALDELVQQRVFARTVFAAVESLRESAYLDRAHDPREIATRFFDIENFIKSLSYLMVDVFTVVVLSAFAIVILSFYNPYLVGFALFLVISVLIVFHLTLRPGLETNLDISETKYKTAQWVSLVSRDRTLFHHDSAHPFLLQMTDDFIGRYISSRRAHFRYYFAQNASLFMVQAVSSAALLGLGGWLVIKGELNLGQLVAAEILFSFVVGGVAKLGTYLKYFYDLCTAAKKIAQLTNLPLEPDAGFLNELPWTSESSLDIQSQSIRAGSIVAVTAETQVEASKFLRKLWGISTAAGTAQSAAGELQFKLAGIPMPHLRKKALRKNVLLIDQISTFDTGFLENLKVFGGRMEDPEIEFIYRSCPWLMKHADMNEADPELTSSAEKVMTDGASRRALITVARSLFSKAPIVLIDGIFSEINEEDQRAFIASTRKLYPDRILLIHGEPKYLSGIVDSCFDASKLSIRSLDTKSGGQR